MIDNWNTLSRNKKIALITVISTALFAALSYLGTLWTEHSPNETESNSQVQQHTTSGKNTPAISAGGDVVILSKLTPEERQSILDSLLILEEFSYRRDLTNPKVSNYQSKPDPFQVIDSFLESMELGNIVFNVPKTMNLFDTREIHLVLGIEKSIENLEKIIKAEGRKVGVNIRVSTRMEARLTGNFQITAISSEVQPVSRKEVTNWKWTITPKSVGNNELHLTLSALFNIDSVDTPRAIRTFDETINVEVTIEQKIKSFIQNNWQWLWAVVLVPLVGWGWKRRGHHSNG